MADGMVGIRWAALKECPPNISKCDQIVRRELQRDATNPSSAILWLRCGRILPRVFDQRLLEPVVIEVGVLHHDELEAGYKTLV